MLVTAPAPAEEELGRYYGPRYRTDRHGFTGKLRVALRARAIERQFPAGFKGRLLDVGCGNGAFAVEMKRRGWDVGATEIDDATLQRLRGLGIDARQSAVAMRDGFPQSFDAITCWHVLEHVTQPLDVARWVRGQLATSGLFQATVPNVASWQARIAGRAWLHLDVPRHLYHFTPDTLGRLLRDNGFEVIDEARVAIEYDLFGVMQSALNAVCRQPNVLFERLTGGQSAPAPARDVAISYALALPLAGAGVPLIVIDRLLGGGATLTMTCRRSLSS